MPTSTIIMKKSIVLTTIATALITSIGSQSAQAESLISQVIYPGGYSSTTIYVPFGTTTTTTTDRVITNSHNYPDSNSFSTSTTTFSSGGYYPNRRRQYRQPTVIFQQNNIYPSSSQSTCTTSIIGSPIPSPIPLNRYTGAPCR
jgi:hypothetical protein